MKRGPRRGSRICGPREPQLKPTQRLSYLRTGDRSISADRRRTTQTSGVVAVHTGTAPEVIMVVVAEVVAESLPEATQT